LIGFAVGRKGAFAGGSSGIGGFWKVKERARAIEVAGSTAVSRIVI
jgi:hypothetical protein